MLSEEVKRKYATRGQNFKSLSEYLNEWQNDPAYYSPERDGFHELRQILLEAGYIRSISQRYVYNEDGIRACFAYYVQEIKRQREKNSTDKIGKLFEVGARMIYAIERRRPWAIDDTRSRPSALADMVIRVGKHNCVIELKTNRGSVGSGVDELTARLDFAKKLDKNPLFIWLYDGQNYDIETLEDVKYCNPLCMGFRELMELLEKPCYSKGKGIDYWLATSGGTLDKHGERRQCTLNLKAPGADEKSTDYRTQALDEIRGNGLNWLDLIRKQD